MALAASNPFFSAYVQSDWFGKSVFCGLFLLSALSWWVLAHKCWVFFHVRRLSKNFKELFSDKDPLGLQFPLPWKGKLLEVPHPFFEVYKTMKHYALQMMSKNHFYVPTQEIALSEADLGLIESQVFAAIAVEAKKLEKNLFILSTIVTLGPFLGLLGTVWGILVTFSQLHLKGLAAASNTSMLSGLALALATTVIGLVVAIPALVGYNYLKNAGREYRRDLENFSHRLLATLELHFRRPKHEKAPTSLL